MHVGFCIITAAYLKRRSLPESAIARYILLFGLWLTAIVGIHQRLLLGEACDLMLFTLVRVEGLEVVLADDAELLIDYLWAVHAAERTALVTTLRLVGVLAENALGQPTILGLSFRFLKRVYRAAHERQLTFVGLDGSEAIWLLWAPCQCDLSDVCSCVLCSLISSFCHL